MSASLPPSSPVSSATAFRPEPDHQSGKNVTLKVVHAALLNFMCYLAVGIPLAVLPRFVQNDLGYSAVLAGLAISTQYLATFLTRHLSGKMVDTLGPKPVVCRGLTGCAISGVMIVISAMLGSWPVASLCVLLTGRLILGYSESMVGTGAIIWGISRVGHQHTAKMISWNGIATYGALAVGAPIGVLLVKMGGVWLVGLMIAIICSGGVWLAKRCPEARLPPGEPAPLRTVMAKILPFGFCLGFGAVGFGSLATFVVLYFDSRGWSNAALCLTVFGACFILCRLLFGSAITRIGGFRISLVCFSVETIGLLTLWLAHSPAQALAGAALVGFGFALVYPALGVEVVNLFPLHQRGSALSIYSVFFDIALGITGPVAGLIVKHSGYSSIFLFAATLSVASLALTYSLYVNVRKKAAG